MVPFSYRKEHPEKEGQIFDCIYAELFSDPIAMVRKIYEKFDLEYTDEFEQREAGACLAKAVRKWKFQEPGGNDVAKVQVSF